MFRPFFVFLLPLLAQMAVAQPLRVTLAGNGGKEAFNDVVQLSNGHFLVAGVADNLDWLPANTPTFAWNNPGIANNLGTGRIAFVLELDPTLQQILGIGHLPAGAAEDIRYLKTTNQPGQPTGEIYLSGNTEDSNNGGYFIGKLNGNWLSAPPTALSWIINVRAATGQYPDLYQPWDVGSDGKVVYASGDSHAYNWSAIYRQKSDGSPDVVPRWRVHWKVSGGEFYGHADDFPGGIEALEYSGIVFKRDANRCELRSTNQADYDLWQPDGNGGLKKGKWPLDLLFKSPCAPGQSGNSSAGPGYTGYSPPGTFTYGPSAICIDRRDNALFIGFNAKSVLPDGQPDFEPAVMAMNADGELQWWSRLYHEVRPDGDTMLSTPDQYVDALAIDYSQPIAASQLVVGARCHGNNVENLWEGNEIADNPEAQGFQNRFTGSSGNIHISWLGKFRRSDGTLRHSTYMAEYAEGTGGLGSPHPDPNLDGWPNPNGGWPNVNTTYLVRNMLKTTADGSVLLLGKGRRTITTANAYQKMVKPGTGGLSCWNEFVRQYAPDLSKPLYSSLAVGQWDTLTQAGGDNVRLRGVWKTATGIVAVGMHTGQGAAMPLLNVPAWGSSQAQGESAVLLHYTADNIANPADGPSAISALQTPAAPALDFEIWPNPANERAMLMVPTPLASGHVSVRNSLQQVVFQQNMSGLRSLGLDCKNWENGLYFVTLSDGRQLRTRKLLVQR
jgi:hypothetical protein